MEIVLSKIDDLLSRIEAAQKEGLKIRANMYTYTAAGTGLDACLPPWTEDGGYPALFKRLRDPATRSLVWRAIAAEEKSDATKIQGKLNDMVKKSIDKYPPKKK